jgi:hypothetical protein
MPAAKSVRLNFLAQNPTGWDVRNGSSFDNDNAQPAPSVVCLPRRNLPAGPRWQQGERWDAMGRERTPRHIGPKPRAK